MMVHLTTVLRVAFHASVDDFCGLTIVFPCIHTSHPNDGSTYRSFGAHERHYLSSELKPLLETLGGVAADHGGVSATAMAFTRRMEEVCGYPTMVFPYCCCHLLPVLVL